MGAQVHGGHGKNAGAAGASRFLTALGTWFATHGPTPAGASGGGSRAACLPACLASRLHTLCGKVGRQADDEARADRPAWSPWTKSAGGRVTVGRPARVLLEHVLSGSVKWP